MSARTAPLKLTAQERDWVKVRCIAGDSRLQIQQELRRQRNDLTFEFTSRTYSYYKTQEEVQQQREEYRKEVVTAGWSDFTKRLQELHDAADELRGRMRDKNNPLPDTLRATYTLALIKTCDAIAKMLGEDKTLPEAIQEARKPEPKPFDLDEALRDPKLNVAAQLADIMEEMLRDDADFSKYLPQENAPVRH